MQLNKALQSTPQTDLEVLAVSVDSMENLGKIVGKISSEDSPLKIRLLSDPNHSVIDRYGLLNPDGRGLPHPATYVIDKQGIVRWRTINVDYTKRPDSNEVLEALRSVEIAETE